MRPALWGAGFLTAALLGGASLPALADTTLRMVSWQVEDPAFGPWWRSVIAEFEKQHPGVKVEFTSVPRESFADQMTTLFASGSPPQIVHLASFEFQAFADNGWLEPLDSYVKDSGLDLTGWAGQSRCQWNGETVCLMMLYFGGMMAYNDAMFGKAGIAVPKTYAEQLAAARALTKDTNGDGIVDQYGLGLATTGGAGQYLTQMLSYVIDAGARWTNDQGEPTLDTPEMVEGLKRWKLVIDEKLTPLDQSEAAIRQSLIEGKIAMRVDGPWLWGVMQKAKPEVLQHLKVAVPPFTPPMGGSSNVLGIASEIDDAEKKLVWDFIQIAASPAFQTSYAEVSGSPAPRPGAIPTDIGKKVPHFDLLMQTMQEASAAGIDRIPTGYEVQFNEFSKMIQEETQRMLVENLDPAATAKRMQERALAMK